MLATAELGSVEIEAHGDARLHVTGKGSKTEWAVLPPLACSALDRYIAQRGPQ